MEVDSSALVEAAPKPRPRTNSSAITKVSANFKGGHYDVDKPNKPDFKHWYKHTLGQCTIGHTLSKQDMVMVAIRCLSQNTFSALHDFLESVEIDIYQLGSAAYDHIDGEWLAHHIACLPSALPKSEIDKILAVFAAAPDARETASKFCSRVQSLNKQLEQDNQLNNKQLVSLLISKLPTEALRRQFQFADSPMGFEHFEPSALIRHLQTERGDQVFHLNGSASQQAGFKRPAADPPAASAGGPSSSRPAPRPSSAGQPSRAPAASDEARWNAMRTDYTGERVMLGGTEYRVHQTLNKEQIAHHKSLQACFDWHVPGHGAGIGSRCPKPHAKWSDPAFVRQHEAKHARRTERDAQRGGPPGPPSRGR